MKINMYHDLDLQRDNFIILSFVIKSSHTVLHKIKVQLHWHKSASSHESFSWVLDFNQGHSGVDQHWCLLACIAHNPKVNEKYFEFPYIVNNTNIKQIQ